MPGERLAERLTAFLDRHRLAVLAVWSIAFAIPTAMRAAAKPFWHDEIYTVLLARLPSISIHWAALADGADFAPPLNAFAVRIVRHVGGLGPVLARVPAMLGFWTMAMVVFVMVRERANAALALAAACVPLFTAGYRYSYEARPYGLMMGLAALAWLSWSRAAAGRRRTIFLPLLGVSLAAGLWNHYFAVLVYVPIAAGEATRAIRQRRVDGPLWIAVIASVVAAAPLARLLALSASRTSHFWVSPGLSDIPAAYTFLFGGLAEALAWPIAAIALIALWSRLRSTVPATPMPAWPAHEIAASIASLLLPLLGVLLALVATGGFVARYAMPTVAAVAIVLPLAIGRAARTRVADVVLLLALASAFVRSIPPLAPVPSPENPVAARPLFAASIKQPGPTVVAGELMFLQLWYYTPSESRAALRYLADPELALRYRGSDIVDRNYLALGRWTAVPVERFDLFLRSHDAFRVYTAGFNWQLDGLRESGAGVTRVGSEAGGTLYDVTAPRPR